jgi:hypothetical protein
MMRRSATVVARAEPDLVEAFAAMAREPERSFAGELRLAMRRALEEGQRDDDPAAGRGRREDSSNAATRHAGP